MIDNYIKDLRKCLTIEDVENVMNGRIYKHSNNSKFEDNYIELPNRTGTYTKKNLRFENKIYEILFKVFLFLKLDNLVGKVSLGTGMSHYAAMLKIILLDIEKEQPLINHFGDLRITTIDKIAINYLNNKNIKYTTNQEKTRKLIEWLVYVNNNVPYFLRINKDIIHNANHLHLLHKKSKEEKRKDDESPSKRLPYSLANLKKIVSFSIQYMENYSNDALLAGEMFIKSRQYSDTAKYNYLYNEIGNNIFDIKEPSLKGIQDEINSDENSYTINKSGIRVIRVKNISAKLLEINKKLEASCLVIILMTTGMRNSELVNLKRYPKIEDDEYYHIKRVITKTAKTDEGEEHSICIPLITKKAIEILSQIGEIKDGKKDGKIMSRSLQITSNNKNEADLSGAILNLIKYLCRFINIKKPPLVHQFRHAIAFLIARINQKDGYELARLLLGHKSIRMTLRYLGHYNIYIRNALSEFYQKESTFLLDEITTGLENDKKFYGEKIEFLTDNIVFKGSYSEKFTDLLNKNLLELINKGKIAIIQTPVSLCIHDLTKPEEMVCQRGFNLRNIVFNNPFPSLCEAERCKNAIFTESNIEHLISQVKDIPADIKNRLEKNKFFVENGAFNEEPFSKIINQYKKDKNKKVVS